MANNSNLKVEYFKGEYNCDFSVTYHANGISNRWGKAHRKYIITIETAYGKANFTYHDSEANYNRGKDYLDEDDLLTAVDAFFIDAYCYLNDDFCTFDSPLEESRVKRGCKNNYNKLLMLSNYDEEKFETFNKFVEELNR